MVDVSWEELKVFVKLCKVYENCYFSYDFFNLVFIVKKFLEEVSKRLGEK